MENCQKMRKIKNKTENAFQCMTARFNDAKVRIYANVKIHVIQNKISEFT